MDPTANIGEITASLGLMRIWFGIVFVGVVVGLAWLLWTPAAGPLGDQPVAVDPEGGPGPERAGVPADTRERVEVRSRGELSASPAAIVGRVVDPSGRPVPAASVELVRNSADGYHFLDPARREAAPRIAATVSDGDGVFRFAVEVGQPYRVKASAPGYAAAVVAPCYAGQLVDVWLTPGAGLTGTVTRKVNGRPVAGAAVRVVSRRTTELRSRVVATVATGLEPGPVTLSMTHPSYATPRSVELELVSGEVRVRDMTFEDGVTIRGTVTDAVTGAPIAGAEVGEGWRFDKFVRTDAAGRYEFEGFSSSYLELEVRAEGYGGVDRRVRNGGVTAEVVDFALQPGRRASGRVVSRDGPVEGAYVAAVASEYTSEPTDQHNDWQSTDTETDGTFELGELRTDLHHVLLVAKAGFGTVLYDFPIDELDRSRVDFGDVHLTAGSTVRGHMVDPLGRPIADQRIELRGFNADRWRVRGEPVEGRSHVDYYAAKRTAITGVDGAFVFADLAAGDYVLMATVTDGRSQTTLPVSVPEAVDVEGVRFTMELGLAIRGRVEIPEGCHVTTVNIAARPVPDGHTAAHAEIDGDGAFEIPGLAPGVYDLFAYPYQTPDDLARGERCVMGVLRGVHAGSVATPLRLEIAATIDGRVVDTNDRPIERAYVAVRDGSGTVLSGATTDAKGRFELTVGVGQVVDAEVSIDGELRARERGVQPGATILLRVDG